MKPPGDLLSFAVLEGDSKERGFIKEGGLINNSR